MAVKNFDPVKDIPNLQGKIILVTGGNAGIGKATIHALAQHNPSRIYLCARRRSAAEAAVAEIQKDTKYEGIRVLDLDLASFKSIETCAAEFTRLESRLDILFLNAGVGGIAPALTTEAYEMHFGVNHVGHALFTQLLMPTLLQTKRSSPDADVRVLVTASMAAFAPFLPKGNLALHAMKKPSAFGPVSLYAHSKLANVFFAHKLAQTYPDICVTSSHPGFVKSDIWDKSGSGFWGQLFSAAALLAIGVDVDEGAKSQLWCAVATQKGPAGIQSGRFYQPVGKLKAFKGLEANQKLADDLWKWTDEELTKHGHSWPSASD